MRWLWIVLCCVGSVFGDAFELPLPSRPERCVLDDARLFATEPERLETLEARLVEFRLCTGFEVQVALYGTLIGRTVFEESRRLRDAWIGKGPGLVLVVECDGGSWEIAWTESEVIAGGQALPMAGPSDVAGQDRIEIINQLRERPAPRLGEVEDIEGMVGELLVLLEQDVLPADEPSISHTRLILLGLGLLAGMLLIALAVGAVVARADRRANDRLYFPRVDVPERLGASRGGGTVSSRSFGSSSF